MSTSTSAPVNAPAIFNNPDLFEGSLRVIMKDGNDPWFVAKDVCDALGLMDTQNLLTELDDDERMTLHYRVIGEEPKRGNPNRLLISESGLYSLILRSRKPAAKAFKKWITSVVLPTLRKDGMYVMGEEKVLTGELEETELILKVVTLLNGKVERLSSENAKLRLTTTNLTHTVRFSGTKLQKVACRSSLKLQK